MKKKIILNIIIGFFTILLLYSIVNIIKWKIDNDNTNKQMASIIKDTIIENSKGDKEEIIIKQKENIEKTNPYWDYLKVSLVDVDFSKLKTINQDVVGWINVVGTNINYPFVQTKNNHYYLNHSFDKTRNNAGWVFLDYKNKINELDGNTILYAHARKDNTMFGSLRNIFKSDWYKNTNNHLVKVSTEKENTLWQVFSVYKILNTDDYLKLNLNNNFLKLIKNRSDYKFDTEVNINDKIITLSTCYGNDSRVVLHAKLIKKEIK